jgi:hypothetical protein
MAPTYRDGKSKRTGPTYGFQLGGPIGDVWNTDNKVLACQCKGRLRHQADHLSVEKFKSAVAVGGLWVACECPVGGLWVACGCPVGALWVPCGWPVGGHFVPADI